MGGEGGYVRRMGGEKNLDAGVGVSLNLFKGRLVRTGGIGWMDCKICIDFRPFPSFSFLNALHNRSWSKSGKKKKAFASCLYRTIYSYFLLHPPIPYLPFAFSPFLFYHVAVVRSIISSCNFMPQDGWRRSCWILGSK